MINALVLSGKPTHKFIFERFLPNRSASRRNRLKELAKLNQTIIIYESCHRILATLEDIRVVFPDTEITVARELTKKFEEIIRQKSSLIIENFQNRPCRGEFVVVI